MTLAMQSNGLNHAVSLGNIEVSSKHSQSNYNSRNYDSEDENVSRRNLRHTSSIELYPRPSVYSKGDIREQYCVTDRQLNSIDRPRRERFFGCLSRRSNHTPQSLLGVCVGRRAPSEENIAAYAPFYKHPRYPHQRCRKDGSTFDADLESSYFRRQPASILSTSKTGSTGHQWLQLQANELPGKANDMSNYHCMTHQETSINPTASLHDQATPRTKHVSFARSHTLTSFESIDGTRSSLRIKPAQSQERLIGGKKPGSILPHASATMPKAAYEMPFIGIAQPCLAHDQKAALLRNSDAFHLQQYVPVLQQEAGEHMLVDRTFSFGSNKTYLSDLSATAGINYITYPTYAPPSPEVLVVERKFRNAMKTQATQTDVRKDGFANILALSPRALHKIKVVSQGAQTNGLQNGKKLTKSLSEITPQQSTEQNNTPLPQRYLNEHDAVCRTKSEDISRSLMLPPDQYQDINFYEPPPAFLRPSNDKTSVECDTQFIAKLEFDEIINSPTTTSCANYNRSHRGYTSNSLPRRACGNQRQDSDYYSNSLPRKDTAPYSQDSDKPSSDCADLNVDKLSPSNIEDLLPPPQEYSMLHEYEPQHSAKSVECEQNVRRRSLAPTTEHTPNDTPFKRDDIRRQSMPVYVKVEKLIDGFGPRSSLRKTRNKTKTDDFIEHSMDEKEILIDFKPHPQALAQSHHQSARALAKSLDIAKQAAYEKERELYENMPPVESEDMHATCEEALYENIPVCQCKTQILNKIQEQTTQQIMDAYEEESSKNAEIISAPASPSRVELLANASTYPSSDSLANDNTRDHSDGIWNESQVTVLIAGEQKTPTDSTLNANQLITPAAKRKNLILQHQQRSSIDTDVMDLEEHTLTDLTPTNGNGRHAELATPQQQQSTKLPGSSTAGKLQTPSIAVIKTTPRELEMPKLTLTAQPQHVATESNAGKPATTTATYLNAPKPKADTNNDISECSTNTEEYGTCTETSKRTPGIKTSTTNTTTSSSVTQVPVSTQSSQMDKTHGGSSFESASSLYSVRGEVLHEDVVQAIEKLPQANESIKLVEPPAQSAAMVQKISPAPSISSNSSRSHTPDVVGTKQPDPKPATASTPCRALARTKVKPESVSDEERSEVRYSSSGYYESPQDDEQRISKLRRNRIEEDRKRRKTSMKLDIEKENIRALTSPIKKPQSAVAAKEHQSVANNLPAASPNKTTRRFRTKPRRPMKKQLRSESVPKQQKLIASTSAAPANAAPQELLLDFGTSAKPAQDERLKVPSCDQAAMHTTKSTSEEGLQPKTKSVESLRSVSPGSDSVFYSEIDGVTAEPHGLCTHCGKEVEGTSMLSIADNDSVESIPFNKSEADIVRPPSDFADSPITTKTTQRLYKKVDKRMRSEERYHGERGRLYKTRQENIRAKSEERTREHSARSPQALRSTGSSPCVLPHGATEFNQQIIYTGHYDKGRYARLTDEDVWTQLDHQTLDRNFDRRPSTDSERNFHSKYQVILHRLVQRRCTLEMYQRQKNNTFQLLTSAADSTSLKRKLEDVLKLMLLTWARQKYMLSVISNNAIGVDKTILVKSDSGEFGFRIHGSKPVVVAAIEPDTPAENSGLEVGDIIISVNGVQVLDKHHTEVVKIAHDGCETLELQVARTISVLMSEQQDAPRKPIYCGYLWRQSGQAKGVPNTKKWVRRWFCLRPDNCLYYYKTEDDTKPVGAMILTKHNVEHCPADIGRPFAFKVDAGEGIPLYVAADSESNAEKWINYLKDCAAQDNKWLEKSAHNLYQPPSSITRPECVGYLMKLGSRWCGWSKRYCVLKDACLYFYQDINSKSAFGMACLHGYKVSSMSSSASGKKNSFELIPPESKLRHYYFCTETEMDKKRWISALEYSIDRWIKSG